MFEWQIDEEPEQTEEPERNGRKWGKWVLAAIILLFIAGGGGYTQNQLSQREADLREQVQDVLNFERDAYLRGDGGLFFSAQVTSPSWVSAQLNPLNQTLYVSNPQATKVEQHDNHVWANVNWTEGGQVYQRVLFFQLDNGRLRQIATSPDYWGPQNAHNVAVGQITLHEIDQAWLGNIAAFTRKIVWELCPDDCGGRAAGLQIIVANNYNTTAAPTTISVPSPRLVALTETGEPAQPFWDLLEMRIREQFEPTVIRFGIPPFFMRLVEYEDAAEQFMAENPDIVIELVPLPSNKLTPSELYALDGAAITPDATLVASGAVFDITDFVETDPDFDAHDFYEQIWHGAEWQERLWYLPQAGAMRMVYYDKLAYENAHAKEPSLRWTWDELARDLTTVTDPTSQRAYQYGFMDVSTDALFSYAYNWKNSCTEAATIHCDQPLTDTAVAAALKWLDEMSGQTGKMPNVAEEPDFTLDDLWSRSFMLDNWQSARRRAVIWVDEPTDYEFRYLLNPLGVVPFPGSDRFDGITPLHVQGHVISQGSERPYAVWQWLNFLSYQPLSPKARFVPARPSVAEEMRFWRILPRDLGNAMRTAFPFARPITMEEQQYFTWEQIEAVLQDGVSPETAVYIKPRLIWFSKE